MYNSRLWYRISYRSNNLFNSMYGIIPCDLFMFVVDCDDLVTNIKIN